MGGGMSRPWWWWASAICVGVSLGEFASRIGSDLTWAFLMVWLRWHGWPH